MKLCKAIFLFIGLAMIAALVACSSSSSSTTPPPPTIAISVTGGNNQSTAVGTAFPQQLQATVTSNGSPDSGATVTFAAVAGTSGASCTLASTSVTTNSSGVAAVTCTANTTLGALSVTASTTGATTPATFNLTNTVGAPAAIAVSSGNSQTTPLGQAFISPLAALVTDSYGDPVPGVSVTFTVTAGTSGATGSFAMGGATDTETTGSNGVATTSQTLTSSTASGGFTVSGDFPTDTSGQPAVFSLTNGPPALANNNYVFSLSGLNTNNGSLFYVAGCFTVLNGAITTGEQDYVDYAFSAAVPAVYNGVLETINQTGSSITTTADGNLQIVLSTSDTNVGVNGVETLNVALRPSNPDRGVVTEFDASGSASGDLRAQDSTAAGTAPLNGYAFEVSGYDGAEVYGSIADLSMGGVLDVTSTGISRPASIFDANDGGSGTTYSGESLQANGGGVSGPDTFGRVTFTINPSDTTDFPSISWVGYIADSSRIYLVETADSYGGTTGGIAFSQGANTGTFNNSSVLGSTYGAVMTGFDTIGPFQLVTELTFNPPNTVSGVMDFNDLVTAEPASPDPVSATLFTVGSTGRITIPNLIDSTSTATLNLRIYIDGNGNAVAISLDPVSTTSYPADVLGASLGGQVNNSGVTDANFTGNYALSVTGWDGTESGEISGVGPIAATGTGDTLSGVVDLNFCIPGNSPPCTATTGEAVSGSYTYLSGSAGILSPTNITGLDVDSLTTPGAFNLYEVDTSGDSVLIELDFNQLTLGLAQY